MNHYVFVYLVGLCALCPAYMAYLKLEGRLIADESTFSAVATLVLLALLLWPFSFPVAVVFSFSDKVSDRIVASIDRRKALEDLPVKNGSYRGEK